ncbi:MAG: nucleotidyltransferase family protein [Thermoguttaceae bacterium]|jgi:predicted nucleotidyltransferase
MSIVQPLGVAEEQIAEFCRRWRIVEFSLFGSALRDDFRPDSDVDVLVTFAADSRHSLFDLGEMEDELSTMFGRKVDLVEKGAIERSENYIRRRNILSTASVVYAAR